MSDTRGMRRPTARPPAYAQGWRQRLRWLVVGLAACGLTLPAAAVAWKAPGCETTEARPCEPADEREAEHPSDACIRPGRHRVHRTAAGRRAAGLQPAAPARTGVAVVRAVPQQGHRLPDGQRAPLRL